MEILSKRYATKLTENPTVYETDVLPHNQTAEPSGKPLGSTNTTMSIIDMKKDFQKTTTLVNEKQSDKEVQLHKKMTKMEETQAQLIEMQKEILRVQKLTEEKNSTAKLHEEQTMKQKQFEEQIEQKITHFQQDQQKIINETRNSIKAELTNTWNSKIDTISVTVANQVATQLVQVVKQYMLLERGEVYNTSINSMFIQDKHNTPPQITQ